MVNYVRGDGQQLSIIVKCSSLGLYSILYNFIESGLYNTKL